MNWEAIGAIGEWVGAIAVVATLIYLTLQVRESKRSARSAAHAIWAAGQGALLGLVSSNRELSLLLMKGWLDPQELDDATWYPFMTWHQQLLYNTAAIYQMTSDGVVGDDLLELELDKAVAVLAMPGATQWWEAGGRTHVSADLATLLDDRLKSSNRWTTVMWSSQRGFHATAGGLEPSTPRH